MKSLTIPSELKYSACFTDIHFGRRQNSEQHNMDCLNFVDFFCEQVKANEKVDHIVFLGDWFEHRNSINIQTLNISYEAMVKLNNLGLPIFFLVGNHDLYLKNLRKIHSLIFTEQFKNFTLIDKPTKINDVLFLPYIFPDEYIELKREINKSKIVYGHLELKGFIITGDSKVLDHGPDAEDFKGPLRIWTGHFHKRQRKGNVGFIGNCFSLDYSDANDTDRGLMFYDYVSDTEEFKAWPDAPCFITTTLSDLLVNYKNIIKPNSSIKCLVDEDISLDESVQIREKFTTKYNIREFTLEEPSTNEILEDTDMDLTGLDMETTTNIVVTLLGRIEADEAGIENDILIAEYKEL